MERRNAGMSHVRSVGMSLDRSATLSKFHTGILTPLFADFVVLPPLFADFVAQRIPRDFRIGVD